MALIVLAMTLILDLETPDISDFLKLALIIGALGRIIWIFPVQE